MGTQGFEDARRRRTRTRLERAILTLATECPVGLLSTSEVAAAARVNRSTFYAHAESPSALLESLLIARLEDECQDATSRARARATPEVVRLLGKALIQHVSAFESVYRMSFQSAHSGSRLEPMLVRTLAANLEREFVQWIGPSTPAQQHEPSVSALFNASLPTILASALVSVTVSAVHAGSTGTVTQRVADLVMDGQIALLASVIEPQHPAAVVADGGIQQLTD